MRSGVSSRPAASEAISQAERGEFDLALLDVAMPEMDGLAATQEIRKRERARNDETHLPIIAMTANVMRSDRDTCLQAGMDDHVAKPFRRATVSTVLQKYLGVAIADVVSERSVRILLAVHSNCLLSKYLCRFDKNRHDRCTNGKRTG